MSKSKKSKSVKFEDKLKPLSIVVALTSFTNEKTYKECLDAGMVDVINKPLNYKALHRVMWNYFFMISPQEYRDMYRVAFNDSSYSLNNSHGQSQSVSVS